jgi:hypothetical protein
LHSFQSEEISGLYELEQNQLAVVGDVAALDTAAEFTLSHEYVHSFQDGAYESQIEQMNELATDLTTEYATTAPCVLEGDASLASVQYMSAKYGPLWITQLLGELGGQGLPEGIPPAVTRYLAFNYSECLSFVQNIQARGGWDAVDALYDRPPATTEQVLHPDKYRSNEPPVELEKADLSKTLGSGWKRTVLSTFGEFDVLNYLLALDASKGQATAAAAGWGAGWLGIYANGSDRLIHVGLRFDNAEELAQFKARYEAVLDDLDGITRDATDAGGTWVWQDGTGSGLARWQGTDDGVDIILAPSVALVSKALAGLP